MLIFDHMDVILTAYYIVNATQCL